MSDKAPTTNKRKPPHSAWKPGQSGNPNGRKLGSRNKATILAQEMIDGRGKELVETALNLALSGDTSLMRCLLARLVPERKDAPIRVDLPTVENVADLPKITGALLAGVGSGTVTPSEATAIANLVEAHRRASELGDVEQRLAAIEERLLGGKK